MEKNSPRICGTTPKTEQQARQSRAQLTPAEEILWGVLRKKQIGGLRFRREHPVGPFILDFYCPSHRLVIEVDGASHENQREYDTARTAHLETYGYRVLRFSNHDMQKIYRGFWKKFYELQKKSKPNKPKTRFL